MVAANSYPAGVVPTLGFMHWSGSDCSPIASATSFSVGYCGPGEPDMTWLAGLNLPLKFLYMDPLAAASTDVFGVSKDQAASAGALATTSSGAYLKATSYDWYMPLLEKTTYQDLFVKHVESILQSHPGISGVYYDNIDYDYHNIFGSQTAVQYSTTAAYRAAMQSFLLRVNQLLQQDGYKVACNAQAFESGNIASNTGDLTKSWWRYLTYPTTGPWRPGKGVCDKYMVEFWQQVPGNAVPVKVSGTTNTVTQSWDTWQALIPLAHTLGSTFGATGEPDGTGQDDRIARYLRASLLLEWDGSYDDVEWANSAARPSDPSFTSNVGFPTGAATAPQPNVSKRTFQYGFVVVNHSGGTITQDGYTIASADARIVKTS